MFKILMRVALVAILCAQLRLPGYGQSAVDGAIGGTVEDGSGSTIASAIVTVRSNSTNAEQIVSTAFFIIGRMF